MRRRRVRIEVQEETTLHPVTGPGKEWMEPLLSELPRAADGVQDVAERSRLRRFVRDAGNAVGRLLVRRTRRQRDAGAGLGGSRVNELPFPVLLEGMTQESSSRERHDDV